MPRFIAIAKSSIFVVEMFLILTHNAHGHLSDVS